MVELSSQGTVRSSGYTCRRKASYKGRAEWQRLFLGLFLQNLTRGGQVHEVSLNDWKSD
jgi:hypothetical protein